MNDFFHKLKWVEYSPEVSSLLAQEVPMDITPMASGLEADVFQISTQDSAFVLKVWNRNSKPDISVQYKLLKALHHQRIAASKPLGWGMDQDHHQVLLTSFDGAPLHKLNKAKLTELAAILAEVHKIPLETLDSLTVPTYNFVKYFFPGVDRHPDIKERLIMLVEQSKMEQKSLIHGDYHLGNIVETDGKCTIIDWTNVQLGDPRYDIAWSIILIWIYVNERHSAAFRSLFLTKYSYTGEELELFEALACLRWILLNRFGNLPQRNNTITTVRTILTQNKYLNEALL
ncbi:phosphotransferase family protein [Paenibacillus rigui]|uniref:Aminoglycoside phosphotransferase n=1 Tax=Paenibacillus rigui TaxID=554312 RepID=A0A229UK87_9BACL|nr:aminoglycoside phosphotransferase family protein [Paenibacillus rigui]OXM83714.1 aminoglycoside phosphotransferase [Paenibacillus rigui]